MSGYKLPLNFGTKLCMWNYEIAMETFSVKLIDEVNKSKAHKLIIIVCKPIIVEVQFQYLGLAWKWDFQRILPEAFFPRPLSIAPLSL